MDCSVIANTAVVFLNSFSSGGLDAAAIQEGESVLGLHADRGEDESLLTHT